jgi:hypothetical protein
VTELDARRLETEIGREYTQLVTDACEQLFEGRGWDSVVHDRRGAQALVPGNKGRCKAGFSLPPSRGRQHNGDDEDGQYDQEQSSGGNEE